MTNKIQGRKLSKQKHVVSKSFSSCTVDDMCDFVKFFIRCKLDEIFLHIETNKLNDKIIDLARFIEQESPSSKLAVQSLVVRKDDLGQYVPVVF